MVTVNLHWFVDHVEPNVWDVVDPWMLRPYCGGGYEFAMLWLWDLHAPRYMWISEPFSGDRLIGYNYYNSKSNFTVGRTHTRPSPGRWP